jgi:hypothetical protein
MRTRPHSSNASKNYAGAPAFPTGTALALHIAFEGAQVAAQSLGRERVAKSLRKIVDAHLSRSE